MSTKLPSHHILRKFLLAIKNARPAEFDELLHEQESKAGAMETRSLVDQLPLQELQKLAAQADLSCSSPLLEFLSPQRLAEILDLQCQKERHKEDPFSPFSSLLQGTLFRDSLLQHPEEQGEYLDALFSYPSDCLSDRILQEIEQGFSGVGDPDENPFLLYTDDDPIMELPDWQQYGIFDPWYAENQDHRTHFLDLGPRQLLMTICDLRPVHALALSDRFCVLHDIAVHRHRTGTDTDQPESNPAPSSSTTDESMF